MANNESVELLKEIKKYLTIRHDKNASLKAKNFALNKGMSGAICTPQGKELDMFYKGRIELLDQLLNKVDLLLKEYEEKENKDNGEKQN